MARGDNNEPKRGGVAARVLVVAALVLVGAALGYFISYYIFVVVGGN